MSSPGHALSLHNVIYLQDHFQGLGFMINQAPGITSALLAKTGSFIILDYAIYFSFEGRLQTPSINLNFQYSDKNCSCASTTKYQQKLLEALGTTLYLLASAEYR